MPSPEPKGGYGTTGLWSQCSSGVGRWWHGHSNRPFRSRAFSASRASLRGLSAVGAVRGGVAEPGSGTGSTRCEPVARIDELAPIQRQAPAADALVEPFLQPLQLADPLVDACRPRAREPQPVAGLGHTITREFAEF